MRNLKQSTAVNVMVFMTDSTDHLSGKESLTLTITASKNGGAFGSITPTVTERGNGWYSLALTTSHTDTLGDFALHITSSGADSTDALSRVIAVDLADAVHLGLSALPNAAAAASGGLITVGTSSGQINPSGGRIPADMVYVGGAAISTPNVSGVPVVDIGYVGGVAATTSAGAIDANVTEWSGTSVATPDTAGYPKVTLKSGTGTGEVNLSSGNLAGSVASVVGAVGSVTGAVGSISGITFPTNFASTVIDSSGRVQVQYGTSAGQVNLSGGNLAGAVPSVTGAVGSVTGAVGSVTGSVGSVTGAVGSVTGAVGSISGITFPTNFASTVIDSSGRVQVQYGTSTGQINLSGGNLAGAVPSVTGAVGSVTGSVGSVTGAVGSVTGNVGGNILGSVASVAGSVTGNVSGNVVGSVGGVSGDISGKVLGGGVGVINGTGVRAVDSSGNAIAPAATALSTANWTNTRAGYLDNLDATISSRSTYAGGAVASVTGNVAGNVTGSVGSVAGDVAGKVLGGGVSSITGTGVRAVDGSGAALATHSDITGLSIPTAAGNAAAVWDLATSGHTTDDTFGKALATAASAGDPWGTLIPGLYGAGTAGFILGTNLDAAVSTRSTYAGGAVASVTGAVGSVTGAVGSISGITFPTNFASTVIDSNGRVQVQYGTSAGQVNLSGGNLAGAVPSVTGAVGSVTGAVGSISGVTFPTNFASTVIDSSGRVQVQYGTSTGQINLSSGNLAGAVPSVTGNVGGSVGSIANDGTAQTGGSTTITLASGDTAGTNAYIDRVITITGGAGLGQSRLITGYDNSTKIANVHRAWDTTPTNTSTYKIDSAATSNLVRWLSNTPNALQTGRVDSYAGASTSALTFNLTGNITGNLSGSVGSVTGAVGSVTGNVGGNVTGSVGSINSITFPTNFASTVIDSNGRVQVQYGTSAGQINLSGGNLAGAVPSVTGNVGGNVTGSVGSVTGNVGGNVTGSVGSVAGAVGSVAGDVDGKVLGGGAGTITGTGVRAIDSSGNAIAPAATALSTANWTNTRAGYLDNLDAAITSRSTLTAAGVWDLDTVGHTTAGTFGAAMAAAGTAGDPWTAPLPGEYGPGTAGKIVGTNLDQAVSTIVAGSGLTAQQTRDAMKLAPSGGAADSGSLDNLIGVIKGRTDNLPNSPAAVGSAMTLTSAYDAAKTAASASAASAIQAKTDNLPASPAAVGSAMTLTSAYDAAKTAAQAGNAMTLTAAYDAAKTAASASAASAIQAKTDLIPASPAAVGSAMILTSAYDAAKTAAQAGNAMTLTAAYDAAKTAASSTTASAIQAKTDNLPASPAAVGSAMTLTSAGVDAVTVETGINLRQAVSILLAYEAGVKTDVTTATPTIANPAGTATRALPTVDADGNCSANTLSPPA